MSDRSRSSHTPQQPPDNRSLPALIVNPKSLSLRRPNFAERNSDQIRNLHSPPGNDSSPPSDATPLDDPLGAGVYGGGDQSFPPAPPAQRNLPDLPALSELPTNPLPLQLKPTNVLPGTEISYDKGHDMYRHGVAFCNTKFNTVAYSADLSHFVNEVGTLSNADHRISQLDRGEYNNFYSLSAELQARASAFGQYDQPLSIGMRRTRFIKKPDRNNPAVFARFVEKEWTELWYGLMAAAAGIGPPIIGGGLTSHDTGVMLMQRGIQSVKDLMEDTNLKEKHGNVYALSLDKLMVATGTIGMILCDIKPGNMIVMSNEDLLLIDFDPSFTVMLQPDDKMWNSECVEFINIFLLLSHTACLLNTEAVKGLTFFVRARLRTLIDKFSTSASDSNDLCGIFVKMARANASYMGTLMKVASTNPKMLAAHILYMAGHYLGWYSKRDESQLPDDQYDCIPKLAYGPNDLPIIEQIAKLVLESMKSTADLPPDN